MPATEVTHLFFETKPLWVGKVAAGGVASAAATTIPAQSLTGLTSGNAYIVTANRVNATGTTKNPANQRETFIGKVSGDNFINCTRAVEGAAQAWDADTVLEILNTATIWDKLVEGIEKALTQTGRIKSETLYATDTGAANAYVVSLSPAPTAYVEGMEVKFKAANANTGASTINVNSLGIKTIKRHDGTDVVNGDIIVNQVITLTYDGTNFKLPFAFNLDTSSFSQSAIARQAIINGNFDIWQRATSMTNPVSNSIAADRWRLSFANSGTLPTTIIHSRQALTPGDIPNSFYHYRIAPNGAGSGFATGNFYNIQQPIEHGVRFLAGAGKKVTISFYAKSDIAGKKLGIGLQQEYGTGGSPSGNDVLTGQVVTLTNAWVKYTATINLSTLVGKTFGTNDDDVLRLFFFLMWGATIGSSYLSGAAAETFGGSGNIDIAQVQVCAGDTALAFQPRSFEGELQKCQRYYCKSYDYASSPGVVTTNGVVQAQGYNVAARPIMHYVFPVKMRTAPTVHIYSPATGTIDKFRDASAGVDRTANILYVGEYAGQTYDPTYTAPSGNHIIGHFTADAEL